MGVLFDVTPVERALDQLLAYRYPCDMVPTIRISNPTSRAQRADEYAQLLSDVDEIRSAMKRLGAQLTDVNSRLQQCRAFIATALVPVTGLPTEVLREIFMLVAESDRTSKARIRLSHVSSAWRAVSLGLRELWTLIQVPRHSPNIVHEFAARSGDLRLELYCLPGNDWPADLELTPAESSRLSAMSSASHKLRGVETIFKRSLMQLAPLIRIDSLVVSGPDPYIFGGMESAKSLLVSDTTFDHFHPFRMERLMELSIDNITDDSLSELMDALHALLLRHLTLSRVWVTRPSHIFLGHTSDWHYMHMLSAPESDEEDTFQDFKDSVVGELTEPIALGGRASQIISLVVDQCHRGVMISIFNHWRMPNLVSLTLVLSTDLDCIRFTIQRIPVNNRRNAAENFHELPHFHGPLVEFLLSTPALRTLDLSIHKADCSLIAPMFGVEHDEFLLPNLRTLSLRDVGGGERAEVGLLQQLRLRSRSPHVQRLQRLSVAVSFVEEFEVEALRECVDQLTLLANS